MQALIFLMPALVASIFISGILAYLGIHVIIRKIIFVDLALAQIAALGSIVAFFYNYHPETIQSHLFSFLFTILGAFLFAITKTKKEELPQEAIIGLTFAASSAASILVADKAPEGAEHIKEILAGTLVWITWNGVYKIIIACLIVGFIHFIFRRKFISLSTNQIPNNKLLSIRALWDFFFYLIFGLMITSIVNTAGILMIFSYLVAPALIGIMLTSDWLYRFLIGWLSAILGSVIGLWISYVYDFPTGPAIVVSLSFLLVLARIVSSFLNSLNS